MFKYILTILAFIGLFLFPNLSDANDSPDKTITFESQRAGYYKIKEVVDGDTFDLTYGEKTLRVRLYGIDTPETKKGVNNR